MSWIVAMTKPNCEQIAAVNLTRQSYENYYPRFLEAKPNKDPVIKPLFPRYIFIYIKDQFYSIKGTRGISYVLWGEAGPQTIPDFEVERLKGYEDKNGLVRLASPEKFAPGQAVKATEGPFVGLPMIYDGMSIHDRVNVLIAMMGRQTRTEIDERVLVPA